MSTKSPFLERRTSPCSVARALDDVAGAARDLGEHAPRGASSKSPPFAADFERSAARAVAAASIAVSRSLRRREPVADLGPELVQRRVHAAWDRAATRQARRIPVEVRAEQRLHAADRAVALRLVEQLTDERPQLRRGHRGTSPACAAAGRRHPRSSGAAPPPAPARPGRWSPGSGSSSVSNSRRMWSTLTVTPASWSAVSPIRSARSTSVGAFLRIAFADEGRDRRHPRPSSRSMSEPVPLDADRRRQLGWTGAERA